MKCEVGLSLVGVRYIYVDREMFLFTSCEGVVS